MQKTFIGILLIITAVVFFALKNAHQVYVDFWFWKLSSNLSLVIVFSVTFGALSSFLLSLPYRARKNREIKEREERIEFLDKELLHLDPKAKEKQSKESKVVK